MKVTYHIMSVGDVAALMMHGAWIIWKARNRAMFDQKTTTSGEVLQEIKAEVLCRKMARGKPGLSSFNV